MKLLARAREKPKTEQTENYSVWKMLRNVLIFTVIIFVIYLSSPFEIMRMSSDGMAPALPDGSISVALKTDEETEFQVGDIITFSADYGGIHYSSITQRIVAIKGNTVYTKPDNNPESSSFTISKTQIRNRILYENIFKIKPSGLKTEKGKDYEKII